MTEVTNLLWTGGWDSTYRLLDLVLVQKKVVQPYYISSNERKSSQLEMQTMDKIRNFLYQKSSEAQQLLLPTIYKNAGDIQPNEAISRQFSGLKASKFLGTQYDFLARFADQSGIASLELSVHKDDHAQKFLQPYIVKEKGVYRLKDDHGYPDLNLFKHFRFPILELTKRDMQTLAKKHGFLSMMNETVFCHTPLPNGKPCGYCNPCRYTMEEGLSRRVPLVPRLKFHIKKFLKG